MSRRKKNTYNPKLITYKEAEQKYGPGGTGGHVMSFDEAQKRQQDYINRIQRMREQQAERERKNRVVSQYQMNRANPAPWMNGGPAARMQAGLDRMQQADEQKEQKTPGFQDWSMVSNLMNPKSGVNRVIATRPQEEQDYWQGVRQDIGKTLDRGKGNDRAAQLLRPLTPEERLKQRQAQAESMMRVAQGQPVNPLQDPRQYAQELYDIRAMGSDQTGDPLMMNREQLVAWRKKYQNKLDQTQRTDEQQARLHGMTEEAGAKNRTYYELNNRGLPVMRNMNGEPYVPDVEEWGGLDSTQFIRKRPEEYFTDENTKTEYDRMMYDAIHGKGAYDAIVYADETTDEDIDALDAEAEHLWRQLEGGNFNVEERAAQEGYFNAFNRENDTRTGGYQRNINLADRYIENWDRIAEMEAQANALPGTGEYDPSRVNYNINLETGKADQLYYYANMDLTDEDISDVQKYGNLHPAQFMTDAQLKDLNKFYENGQYAEAVAYYEAMEPYLQQMKSAYRTLLEQRMYNNGGAIPMTLYRIATKPVEGAAGLVTSGAALAGADWATDPNSEAWDLARTNANIQNTSADAWARQAAEWFGGGDKGFAAWAARQLNGVMFSIADNLTAFALSGGASKVSADAAEKLTQYAIQFIMSSEATAGTMFEQLESGADPTRAGIMAFGSGIIEAITEKYSLETILDPDARAVMGTKGALMGYLGKASLAEGSEEIASDLLDTGLDFIMSAAYGDAPELIRQYEDLIAQGVKPNDATRQVLLGYLEQLGTDGLAGALSGLLMSGSRAFQARGLDNYQTRSIGNTVTNQGVEKGMSAKEKSGAQYSNFMKLNEAAKMLQPGSEARRIAQEIEADVKKGGTVSMKKAGKLTRAIMKESNEQIGQVAEAVLGDTLTKQLTDEGIAPEDAARYSAVLREAVETGRMTPEAMLILSEDERARNLWSEIVKSEDVKSAQKAQKSVMELMTGKDFSEKGVQEKDIAARMAVADWLRDGDAELAEAQGERTGDADEVVANGRIGKIEGFGVREFKGADGQKHWAVTATIRSGSETFEADLSDVQATSENEAKLLQFLNEENGQSIGANVSAALVKTAVTAKDMAGAVTDAVNIVMSQFTGKEIKVTTLNKTEEAQVRQAAEEDIRAEDAEAARSAKALRPGQGKVTYDGMMYGTKQFAEATGKLSAAVRDEMDYVARMMKAVGMDTEFYYDEEESANQGVFIGGEGIRINLAGTFDKDGTHRSAVATAGHESLHWLRANSPEAYRQMRSFVLNHLEDAGYNIADEAKRITANYARHGEFLTIGKAIEEMVAMANERVLTDETLVTQLQEEEPTVYSKVRQAVKRALDMLRRVMGGTKATSSRYAAALDNTLNDIAKVWKLMLDQSQGAKATGEKTGTAAHSIQDEDYMAAVNNGDMETAQRIVENVAKEKGYTQRAYHGTEMFGFTSFDMGAGQGTVFVAYDMPLAATYQRGETETRPISSSHYTPVNHYTMDDDELAAYYLKTAYKDNYIYEDVVSLKRAEYEDKNAEKKNHDTFELTYRDGGEEQIKEIERWKIYQDLDQWQNPNGELDGIYDLFIKPGKQLVIDAEGENWNEITAWRDKELADKIYAYIGNKASGGHAAGILGHTYTTRQLADFARANGYDSLRINNVQDNGGRNWGYDEITGDIGIIFNPNDVKSADTVTYDGDGKVIPPSERFKAEKQDIRYSKRDEEYMAAAEKGDTETAARLVEEAAKEAFPNSVLIQDGKFRKMWHHTNKEFTEFLPGTSPSSGKLKGIYFTPQESSNMANMGTKHMQVYLNVTNPKFAFSVPADREYVEMLRKRQEGVTDRNELARINREFMEETGVDAFFDWQNGWYNVMTPEQIKSAEPIVRDDNGNIIPLSERFNAEEPDIRYSFSDSEIRKDNENPDSTADLIMNSKGEVLAQQLPGNSYTMNSWRTWEKEDIKELTAQLVKRGFEGKDVRKWIQDVNNIAKYIVDHKDTLDYEASPYFTMLKNNQEYVKTLDASTLCAKRLLYQGIFNEIQRQMPNTPLMPEDLIKLINMMKKKGLTTPCGFCYVESRRKQLGKYAQQFLDGYKGDSTGYKPKIYDVTTTDGLEKLRTEHPEAYDAFVAAMNAKGSANPKVVQTRTEYRGEIRDMTDGQIRKVKEIGGLRVQSFSDFEIVHMIDMMQAVLDMASKELTSQAYTKVPEFAWVFGDTGMKINLSLVGRGTGVDENGNLIFDNVEGMDYEKAMELRKRYSKNVGTILVGMNEQHIIAAMGDDSIDFIIPFHKSGWNKKEMTQINGMSSYKDFTRWQNEKRIGSWTASGVKTIPNKKSGIRNFGPVGPNASWDGQNGYWDFKKSGEENARKYLQLCKEDGRVPKFANFLEYDGEGGYRLPEGSDKRSNNIRKGYWKLLIDFKMYDNEGNGSPQTNVRADFNMEAAMDILQKYDGNANTLPKDQEVADRFVKEYKSEHPRRSAYSIMDETDYDVRSWLESVPEWSLTSEAEKALLGTYKSLRVKQGLDRLRMQKIDSELKKLGNQLKKTAEAEGNPERTVTVEEALAAANVKKQGGKLYYKGQLIGTLKYGLLNLTKKAGGVAEELHKSGAFDYDAETETWNTKPQNIHNDDEREIRRQIAALDIRKQNLQTVMDQDTKKLNEILGSKGFGRMMHQQQKMLQNMQNYGTQKELHEHVSQMEETAARIDERIRENKAAVDRIAKTDAMKRVQEILESTTAKEAAASLKREYHSNWTQAEILPYISGIMAKMSAGEDFMNDVEDLAEIMITSDTRNVYEGLSALQGLTITIGRSMQKELKAKNSSLNEIRRKLEGTGIRVKTGATSTLDTDVEDLRAEYPDMPEMGNDLDALDRFIEWVNGMRGRTEDEFFQQYKAEAAANIMQKIAAVMKNGQLYVPKDAKARQQIMDLVEYMKTLNAETAAAQKTLAEVAGQLEELKRSGRAAETKANALMKDVNVALDYYNRISRIAVDEAKKKRTSAEIEQLKSKHAEEIAKRNEEWREQIQRDKDAQKVADDLRKTANKMGTALTRTYNLLKAPKGLNNVPEYMQGAAREMLRMFVENDSAEGFRVKLTKLNREQLEEAQRLLTAWEKQSGKFDVNDLKAAQANEWVMQIVQQDFLNLRDGIEDINREYRGKNRLDTLQHRLEILKGIQEAVSEIYGAIRAEQEVQIGDRKAAVEDAAFDVETGTGGRKYREWTGTMGAAIRNMNRFIVKGNMTPEYFFRTLNNKGLTALWDTYHWAENRNGLELQKAQERLAEIAEKHGYKTWDMGKKVVLHLQGGDTEITLGQLMSLWATWKREKTLGPQMSEHLTKGGFFAEKDLRDGILGRTVMEKKAHRVTEEDMNAARELMTEEQRKFVDDVVLFMSRDMSKLGNEASMAAYGIKLYKEEYYFPFQMWDGVKARKSNESGGAAAANDRAFHPSFSKSRIHGANNALVLGDFMKTATDHIAGMINYATMGLANESLQKVLNQTTEDMNGTKRNVRAVIEEAYGMEAAKYLADLQQQLNGGAVRIERTAYDKLISLFRKNAVAGSLSVALQQPLSYIRAGMMINPKYLARAMSPDMWKGSYKEMMAHSGVAVIKAIGRFDMNAGQSAREYLTPEGLESKGQKVWNAIGEYATILPEKMDAMTWTRMWSAVKAEQHAEHPDMDVKSDKFLDMVGVRFNDLMRRTQVYDSTLVRSSNMRSQNPWMKSLTSFMAEPTLTLNVLADAVRMAKNREAGGMTMLAKAGATFILSAVLQAAVKGFMGARRNPDEKKTWEENFWFRFTQNMMGEANPLSLIPGYGDLVTLLKKGELADDAMGALGKLIQAAAGTKDVLAGLISGEERDWYKDVENSGAQLVQLFTNIPLKNLMRDARAMWNWVGTNPYADRQTSGAVIRMQTEQAMLNADSLLSAALQAAGFKTTNTAYYQRIYQAKKNGNEREAQDLIDYLLKGKGVKAEKIESGIASAAKGDTGASAADTAEFLIAEGANAEDYIRDRMRKRELTAEEARDLLQKADPKKDADTIWWTVDRIQYQMETGAEKGPGGYYYRLTDAINGGTSTDIKDAVKELKAHGVTDKKIQDKLSDWKKEYLSATGNAKVKLKNALIMAYKAAGMSETEANERINKWK